MSSPENNGPDGHGVATDHDPDMQRALEQYDREVSDDVESGNGHVAEPAAIEAARNIVEGADDAAAAETGAPVERKTWAARMADKVGAAAVRVDSVRATEPGQEQGRAQRYHERGQNRLEAAAAWVSDRWQRARDSFRERFGTMDDLRDLGTAARNLGRSLVRVVPQVAVGAVGAGAEFAGRHGRNAGNVAGAVGRATAAAHHEVRGTISGGRERRARDNAIAAEGRAAEHSARATAARAELGAEGTGFLRGIGRLFVAGRAERTAASHADDATRYRAREAAHRGRREDRAARAGTHMDRANAHVDSLLDRQAQARRARGSGPNVTV